MFSIDHDMAHDLALGKLRAALVRFNICQRVAVCFNSH